MRATDDDRAKGREKAAEQIQLRAERAGSTNALARQLKAVGLTLDRFRTKLIAEATSEAVLERELKIEITDEQIKAFYDENPAEFEQPERVRVAHILLLTRDPNTRQELSAEEKEAKLRKIESLLKRARRGEDFAELAVEFSEDTASKDKGGEYTLSRGEVEMMPEFEAAAFSLSAGQVSDVITTQAGYHIIKVYETIPATMLDLDEERTVKVRQFLKGQELRKQMIPFMDDLMKESNVEILDDRLKPQPGDLGSPVADTAPTM
jgi:parvulin-like peptidyl-prolyl isomerase